MRKRSIVILSVVWMVLLVAGVSSAVTMALMGSLSSGRGAGGAIEVTEDEYLKLMRYERLDEVFNQLVDNYYVELAEEDLVLGAVRGMMGAVGDPYTYYYTPEEMKKATEQSRGIYEGIGLLLTADKNGQIVVVRVFPDTPAYEAGVRPGDQLLKVGDTVVGTGSLKAIEEANRLIAEQESTLTVLTLQRGSEVLTLGMIKRAIKLNVVEHQMLDEHVGLIAIYQFTGDDVSAFKRSVKALKEAGATKLIVDVRNNAGGLLTDVVDIADQLMPEGMIVYTQDRDGRRANYFSDASCWDVPMAVLVNGMSASASEILAGALKDSGRAIIVGETTFGKGIVQTQLTFPSDGAGMQLTTATYFTPSGKSIHGVGIAPDIVVRPSTEHYIYQGVDMAEDAQLRAAYDALKRAK